MYIRSIEVQGLRSFKALTKIEFAVPSGAPGSGLTVIIGPNNGGESTLLEAIQAFGNAQSPDFVESRRNGGDPIVLRLENDKGEERVIATSGGSASTSTGPTVQPAYGKLYVLPARRSFPPFFSVSAGNDRLAYVRQAARYRPRGSSEQLFASRLFRAKEPEQETAFAAEVTKILGWSPTPPANDLFWTLAALSVGDQTRTARSML